MNPFQQQMISRVMGNNPMVKRFSQFVQNFQKMNKNPQQAVQELLNSGEMSQQQYESLRRQANSIMGTNF